MFRKSVLGLLLGLCLSGCARNSQKDDIDELRNGLKLKIHDAVQGGSWNVVQVSEEFENTSQHPCFVETRSVTRAMEPYGEWQVVGERKESNPDMPERFILKVPEFPEGVTYLSSCGPRMPIRVNPGETILGDTYTITFPCSGVYRLECKWTICCGSHSKELKECEIISSKQIEVVESKEKRSESSLHTENSVGGQAQRAGKPAGK